jgi:energy-coupling factor transporter ATP-binding protein EcfA2
MQIPLGTNLRLWGGGSPFEIDTTRRTAIFGATGSGKSTLLKHLIAGYLHSGHGFTLQDPHGELVDWTLSMIPKDRVKDVVVFNPRANSDRFVQINPLNGRDRYKRAKDTIEIIATTWANSWGPQSDFISRNIAEAILEVISNPTLLHFDRAFMSRDYLEKLSAKATSPYARNFFRKTLEEWDRRQNEAASAPPTNKFNTFMQPVLRHVVGGVTGLDFARLMDESKILLCRLSVGELGEDISTILAHLIQSELLHAGLERNRSKKRPFHGLIVDEFHKFTRGRNAEQFLNETRKYNIALTIADQGIEQLPEGSEHAVFTNVESLIVGRVSGSDAERLAKELPIDEPRTLQRLPAFQWYGRTQRDGMTTDPVPFIGLEPPRTTGKEATKKRVLNFTRANYAVPKEVIEDNINRFLAA